MDAGSEPVVSLWGDRLPGTRLSGGLSPVKSRGFSGEGSVLVSLGNLLVEEDVGMLSALLSFEPCIDTLLMVARCGLAAVSAGVALSASWYPAPGQFGGMVT